MKRVLPWMLVLAICIAWAGESLLMRTAGAEQSVKDYTWQAFEISDLSDKLKATKSPYLQFLDVDTMRMGLYELPVGSVDRQSPHRQDEAYYILDGKAVLEVGSVKIPVKQGSVVFVGAGADHKFSSISEDLSILVFFSTAAPKEN